MGLDLQKVFILERIYTLGARVMLALLVINLLNSMSFQGDILNVSHAQSFSCIIVMANCSKPFN